MRWGSCARRAVTLDRIAFRVQLNVPVAAHKVGRVIQQSVYDWPMPSVPVRLQSPFLDDLLAELQSLWTPARLSTLSRIAVHFRQFEEWWKWELATHLWELAGRVGADVFVESNGRADITVATPREVGGATEIDPTGPLCVPIELKTTGTWWGNTPSRISKALAEPGQKRLKDDLFALARGLTRQARPCQRARLSAAGRAELTAAEATASVERVRG